ncbi:MAG TPA: hypothetical protein VLT59_08240 [Steroidobacteraceae bacterium]|nr:hypothetical protein [Steroidobacteraceae bacterium]
MRKFITALSIGLFSLGAFAGDYGDKEKVSFEALDKNSDQQISQSEAQGNDKLSGSFAEADTNGDGYLSREEFEAYTKA